MAEYAARSEGTGDPGAHQRSGKVVHSPRQEYSEGGLLPSVNAELREAKNGIATLSAVLEAWVLAMPT